MWSDGVVVAPPSLDQDPGFGQLVEISLSRSSSRIEPLKLSQYPFAHRLPGVV
jgi:hypothetical protein